MRFGSCRGVLNATLVAAIAGVACQGALAAKVPDPVLDAVHGRVAGWAQAGSEWFVVYTAGTGSDWCGLQGATWRIALVDTAKAPEQVIADRSISGAMCGNSLAWVRVGRFSDGRHEEAVFMLWTTPSIGATTYIYRIDNGRIRPLATFAGDKVTIGKGRVIVSFENRGRSRHGELRDVYRFENGRYKLVSRS